MITIYVDDELGEQMKARCRAEHRSVSSGGAYAIARWLATAPADKPSTTTEQEQQHDR
jgi:SLT domain-containing protein